MGNESTMDAMSPIDIKKGATPCSNLCLQLFAKQDAFTIIH